MERAEFETLAVAELDALYRYAHYLTRDRSRAEDLVQDVYARALRPATVAAFEPMNGGMRAWLMTIARTTFYGTVEHEAAGRRAMDKRRAMGVDPSGDSECPRPHELDGLDWSRVRERLNTALDSLNDDLRDVLWLWAIGGLKYKEIAEMLDMPIGTVMSRLHRARAVASRAVLSNGGRRLLAETGMAVGVEGGIEQP